MSKVSSRVKLFISIISFAGFAALMFSFGYSIMENRNQSRLEIVNQKNLELLVLQREQQNFEQGKRDLATLLEKPYPPQELFSRDTKVVGEIRTLEAIAARYSLDFTLQVAGSAQAAPKAKGVSGELLQIPYSVTVSGPFNNILKYIEATEHANFINQAQAIELTAISDGNTRATINSQFYLTP